MAREKKNSQKKASGIHRYFWPVYLLNGLQSVGWGGLIFLIVPISRMIWPGDPSESHAVEMGILITTLAWSASISGLILGRLIDKYNRRIIMIIISVVRGVAMLMLGFAVEGGGTSTWIYFMIFVGIFGFAAGLSWPTVISLSNDIVPKEIRSRFFGYYELIRSLTMILGFLVGALAFQSGFWRIIYWSVGISILICGFIFVLNCKEPKRGAQQEELSELLKQEGVYYEFQIDGKMMRKTMFSRTNVVALIEGIFTWILMGSINFLILNLVQNPPHNISEFSTAIFMIMFGMTGGMLGQILLSRLSDKLAKKKLTNRVFIIIFSLIGGLLLFALFFWIPWPELTEEQGKDILFLMTMPAIYLMGALFFSSRAIFSMYTVNQSPVIQEINLPEAQGQIVSWNQFLENLGRGIGPTLSGIILVATVYNYQMTILILVACILPGVILWGFAIKWFPNDVIHIRSILKERADIMASNDIIKDTSGLDNST